MMKRKMIISSCPFSVDGFSALIAKMRDLTSSEDEKAALKSKDDQIKMRWADFWSLIFKGVGNMIFDLCRYADLLARAQEGQAKLRDAVDLAERWAIMHWYIFCSIVIVKILDNKSNGFRKWINVNEWLEFQ